MDSIKNMHGGNLEQARLLFPHVETPWLDLSTGINPYSYPVSCHSVSMFQNLPSLAQEEQLREIAAIYYGCKNSDFVAVAPGSQILISQLPYLLAGKRICIYGPTYMEHYLTWSHAGKEVFEVFSLTEFLEFSKKPECIGVLCNPNNPDGRLLDPEQLAFVVQSWKDSGNLLVIDEAFMDFEGEGATRFLSDSGLVILRSFGKTYGLAGIRLGFLLSDPAFIQKVRQRLGVWSVGGVALQTGIQALQDRQWLEDTRYALQTQERRLEHLCERIGLEIIGGTALFKLIYFEYAQELWSWLANYGIWVRKFDYNDNWLRFGMLYKAQDWKRLEKVILDYFSTKTHD